MPQNLETHVKSLIQEKGPLSVADYMDVCLMHPQYGYYTKPDAQPIGAGGDFTTSPEISQMFGEVLGAWVAALWLKMEKPERLTLIELGPGRGTLMSDALRATSGIDGFHDALRVRMVEAGPAQRAQQEEKLKALNVQAEWADSFKDVETGDAPCLILANEFFDCLPVHQYMKGDDGWLERVVALDEDENFTVSHVPSDFEGEGVFYEDCPAARAVMKDICALLKKNGGALLALDYGHDGSIHKDTFQAVQNHAFANPLENLGDVDLTAHVDFGALKTVAEGEGLSTFGPLEQGIFLQQLGICERAAMLSKAAPDHNDVINAALARLIGPRAMGRLFKAFAAGTLDLKGFGF